ncbi:MAG TPA: phosphatase PAP2 family protein [Methanocella sp.]|jgi:undecaprenyl-diphosphatase
MIDPDRTIGEALNRQVLPAYYWFFSTITWLGSASLWLLILAGCIVINRWRKIASVLFIVILFSMVVNEDIKEIVQRIRPGDVVVGGYFVAHSYSFPSGHTQTAFVIATVLSAFLARRYNVITYLLAAAVGMSRIYLGVHYLTDVVAGAAVGIVLGVLAVYCLEKLGLYDGDGMFEIAPRSKGKATGSGWHDKRVIRYAALILLAGYLAANLAFYLPDYTLSLVAIGIMYILLLLLPTVPKVRSQSNC